MFQTLTIYSEQAALILMGLILVVTVMFAPQGCFVGLGRLARWRPRGRRLLREAG
jgi:branched-chain amino acid transport system permease protein